jgi:hypothetical protein
MVSSRVVKPPCTRLARPWGRGSQDYFWPAVACSAGGDGAIRLPELMETPSIEEVTEVANLATCHRPRSPPVPRARGASPAVISARGWRALTLSLAPWSVPLEPIVDPSTCYRVHIIPWPAELDRSWIRSVGKVDEHDPLVLAQPFTNGVLNPLIVHGARETITGAQRRRGKAEVN